MMNLATNVLRLLPLDALLKTKKANQAANDKADNVVKKFMKKVAYLTSIVEWRTEGGPVTFISDSSENGIDFDEGESDNALGSFLDTVDSVVDTGAQIYGNVMAAKQQYEEIKDCLGKFLDMKKFSGAGAAAQRALLSPSDADDIFAATYAPEVESARSALAFIAKSNELDGAINDELIARVNDPEREPCFLDKSLSAFGFCVVADEEKEPEEIFRLVFGPPKSMEGKFLLSQDGLYYDSQTSGIEPALLSLQTKKSNINLGRLWKFDYDSNIGGRGTEINQDKISTYVDTLFDPDDVDDSAFMEDYYREDRLVMTLIGQKDKRIHDLSAHVTAYEGSGSGTAIIINTRQQIISEGAIFDDKIRKRKKQIELAVKLPFNIYWLRQLF